jgi:hypothetical protein
MGRRSTHNRPFAAGAKLAPLFPRPELPHRVRPKNSLGLFLVVPFAEKPKIVDRIRAAPRVRDDMIDL